MLRIYFVIFSLFIVFNVFSKDNEEIRFNQEMDLLQKRIESIEKNQEIVSGQVSSQAGMLDTAFDGVSAELSASSNFIGVFGVIIALFSIGLSIYVSKIETNVRNLKVDNEILLQKNIQIKQDLEILSDKITNDSNGLFKIIRNEESNHLIERLISVPEDITNLFSSLTSRDLEKEQFYKLKEAFLQVKRTDPGYSNYLVLFFQHFSDLAVLDPDIKPQFLSNLNDAFKSAFKNDVIKSTADFFSAISTLTITKSITELNKYIYSLSKSIFAETDEVYFAINSSISKREQKFELYDGISKSPDYIVFRKKFGTLILDYKYENLTSKELAIIEEIKELNK